MTRRLVLIDRYDDRWVESAARHAAPGDEWDILLLGLAEARFQRDCSNTLGELGRWRILDLVPLARQAHAQVAEFLVPLVDNFPRLTTAHGRRLAGPLATRDQDWWWFLETSEKSPMRGPLVGQLYGLALLRGALSQRAYDEVWAVLDDLGLRRTLQRSREALPPFWCIEWQRSAPRMPFARVPARYWRRALRTFWEIVAFRTIARLARWQWPEIGPGSLLFYTVFPSWWLRAFTERPVDRFFPGLPPERAGVPLAFAAWLDYPWRGLWRRRREISSRLRRHRLVPLQAYLRPGDALALLSPVGFARVVRFLLRCRASLHVRFEGFDVASLIMDDLARSVVSRELFVDRWLARAVNRVAATHRPRGLVFRMECQPLERALACGARGHVPTVGFWHSASSVGSNYLPYHFAPGGFERAVDGKDRTAVPLPDAMLVPSRISAQTVMMQGYPEDLIAVCGPVRHRDLVAYLRSRESRPEIRRRLELPQHAVIVLVATSVVQADSEALLFSLPAVVEGLHDFRVVLKIHPAKRLDASVIEWVAPRLGPERVLLCPSDANGYDYIAASDVMLLGGGSTIAFEAIALGVMPIAFENPTAFNALSLADFAEGCFVVRSPAELRRALHDTLSGAAAAEAKRRQWPALLERVFEDLHTDPNESLAAALESLGVFPAGDRERGRAMVGRA